jgi:hypothetical protein
VVRKPKIQKVKEKKKKIIIKVENIGPNKIVVCTEMVTFHASENDFICEDCGKCLKSIEVVSDDIA